MLEHHSYRRYAVSMRTTVTLDPDVELIVRELMRHRGVPFKVALNDAVRAGRPRTDVAFSTTSISLGEPTRNLDRAMALAGELEDEALLAKMERDA